MSQPSQGRFIPPDIEGAPALYREFWSLWREEKFFECHEVLEDLWRVTPGPERWFYNALIHCAVSIYQHRRGNAVGATRQLVRAQAKMAPFAPRFGGLEIEALMALVESDIADSVLALTQRQRAAVEEVRLQVEARVAEAFPAGRFNGSDIHG